MYKIAISNIAWEAEDNEAVIDLMHEYAICGLELAPAKINPVPHEITTQQIADYKAYWQGHNIELCAMQALLYGAPYMAIFEGEALRNQMLHYLKKIISTAGKLGITRLVFGSPKNRLKGDISEQEAFEVAVPFFNEIGDASSKEGVIFCIEPNPEYYNCDLITDSKQGVMLVDAVNNLGFGLHLDAAGMSLSGEKITEGIAAAANHIRHFHISEKDLAVIGLGSVDHAVVAKALQDIGYNGWVSIEMRSDGASSVSNVKNALKFVKQHYV